MERLAAPTRAAAAVGGGLVAALLVARWPPLALGTYAVVLVAGGIVFWAGLQQPTLPASRRAGRARWGPWLALAVAFCLWELALLLLGNNDSWPPLSRLADPLDQLGLGRFLLASAWLLVGGWVLRRGRE